MEFETYDILKPRFFEKTASHLWKLGKLSEKIAPEISRFHIHQMQEMSRNNQIKLRTKHQYCVHCGSLWSVQHKNFHLQLKARPKLSKRQRQLYRKWKSKPYLLVKKKRKLMLKLRETSNQAVYHCHICKHKTSYNGSVKVAVPKISPGQGIKLLGSGHPSSAMSRTTPITDKGRKKHTFLQKVLQQEFLNVTPHTSNSSSKSRLKDFLRSV